MTPQLTVCCQPAGSKQCNFSHCASLVKLNAHTSSPPYLRPQHKEDRATIVDMLVFDPAKSFHGIRVPEGMHFVCGDRAYRMLPLGWVGRCHLGVVFPGLLPLKEPMDLQPSASARIYRRELLRDGW